MYKKEKIIETKICKHCSCKFDITDKDLEFYEKISPVFPLSQPFPPREKGVNEIAEWERNTPLNWGGTKGGVSSLWNGKVKYLIPSPTLCPNCREQRRRTWRNERNLYKRKCDFSGRDIISIYSPDKPYKVYDQEIWWSDKWEGLDYGRDFDFSKSFFGQFDALLKQVPLINLYWQSNEDCDYTFDCNFSKDCYMSVIVDDWENVLYSNRVFTKSRDIVDSYYVFNGSSLVYESSYINNCHNIKYCFSCKNSKSLILCNFCENCEECIGSKNLVWKKYYVFNIGYSKEEYLAIKKQFEFKSFKEKADILFLSLPVKSNTFTNCENCQWWDLTWCKNCYYCFNGEDSKNIKYSAYFTEANDCYDCEDNCYNISLNYECQTVIKDNNKVLFSTFMMEGNDQCFYCDALIGCHNCFWCIGLKNKSYCILNKQYTKEEYETLVPKIIEHMSSPQTSPEGEGVREWGEFFPASISPFGYNETVAQEYFSLSREKVLCHPEFISGSSKGKIPNYDSETSSEWQKIDWKFRNWTIFNWSDYESPFPKVEKIIHASQLPENISEIPDDILNWAIECEITKKPFRIVKQELEFYRKYNLPIPKRHPDQRHLDRMKLRNPRKLFDRKCDKCKKEIQTTYAPERSEIVYCQECYEKEIY